MATWSIVNSKEINIKDRCDAEYFKPEFLGVAVKLKKSGAPKFKSLAKLDTSAFYPAATHLYSVGKMPFIRCTDVVDYPVVSNVQDKEFERLPYDFILKNPTIKTLKSGDIVITKVGTPCYASVIDDSLKEVALSRTVLGVKKIKINPYYLVAFLRSKYGFYQLMRERELTIQLQLTLDRVYKINIFIPKNIKLTEKISAYIKEYFDYFKKSVEFSSAAENLLLCELGLKEFKPKYEICYSTNLSDAFVEHRADAEFFQPAYKGLLEKLQRKAELKPLKKFILSIQKGIEPGSDNYQDKGKPFIRVSNLSINGLTDKDQKYLSEESYQQLRGTYEPKQGDFLLTKDATPGIAYVIKEPFKGIISSGILKLTINESEINKEYLALCINSIIGRMQIERDGGGSVIIHWKPEQVKKLKIPILPDETQEKIALLVQQSHEARSKSKELLDTAKKAVEIAIEKNESEAMKFISEFEKK